MIIKLDQSDKKFLKSKIWKYSTKFFIFGILYFIYLILIQFKIIKYVLPSFMLLCFFALFVINDIEIFFQYLKILIRNELIVEDGKVQKKLIKKELAIESINSYPHFNIIYQIQVNYKIYDVCEITYQNIEEGENLKIKVYANTNRIRSIEKLKN